MLRRCLSYLMLCVVSAPLYAAELSAELMWAQRVDLSVPLTGRIEQVAVAAGDAVEAGQLLIRFDQRAAQARVAQARAVVKDMDAQRAEARREWDRAKELFDRTVLAERELQLAENAYVSAEARYQTARAEQVAADVALDYSAITAPFAAWVLAVHVAAGEAAVNNSMVTHLMTLAARDRMRARSHVNAAQANTIQPGSAVTVRVNDASFDGRVVTIALEPAADTRPALYAVDVEFPVPAGQLLRAGQTATVVLP